MTIFLLLRRIGPEEMNPVHPVRQTETDYILGRNVTLFLTDSSGTLTMSISTAIILTIISVSIGAVWCWVICKYGSNSEDGNPGDYGGW